MEMFEPCWLNSMGETCCFTGAEEGLVTEDSTTLAGGGTLLLPTDCLG
jgi:hypothetical protein